MPEVRCNNPKCNKLLYKTYTETAHAIDLYRKVALPTIDSGGITRIEIKCPRCGTINNHIIK